MLCMRFWETVVSAIGSALIWEFARSKVLAKMVPPVRRITNDLHTRRVLEDLLCDSHLQVPLHRKCFHQGHTDYFRVSLVSSVSWT